MSAAAWNGSHPDQCTAYLKAWETKQKREAQHRAEAQLITAQAGGMKKKGGGKLTIRDFLPDFAKPKTKKKQSEGELKAAFMALAQRKKDNG